MIITFGNRQGVEGWGGGVGTKILVCDKTVRYLMQCNYFIDIRIRKNTWLMAERGRGQKMVSQNQRCIYIVHIHFYATPRPPPNK